jgi:hypothetical protein
VAFSEEYMIHFQGVQRGPYTFPQLKRLYDKNLIPEEALYWRDGMDELEPVSDLCGASRRERLRRLRRLRIIAIVLIGGVALAAAFCAPVLKDGWQETNNREETAEGAYWRARGFVREEVKAEDASVAFEPYEAASAALSGTQAVVVLPGTLYRRDGTGEKKTWKVAIRYDVALREWLPPGR